MEKIRVDLKREAFFCSICQDLLKDPVVLPCGQSFCKSCVEASWDREDEKSSYQCPQCRQSFTPRPLLQRNIMLAELVEELKKPGLQAAGLCSAGPEDGPCDSSTGRKLKAPETCLVPQPHLEEPSFRRHKLDHPSQQLQETCCQHEEESKMFCRTDQQVVCHLCAVDQHKDHHIVSAAAERGEREIEVAQSRGRIHQSIQEREEEVKLLQQEEKNLMVSADKARKDSQETLKLLIRDLQRRMSDVEQQIGSRQETEAARVRGLQEQLQQEIAELKKKDAELQQLSLTGSHLASLQNLSSLSMVSEDLLSSRTPSHPHCGFEEVAAAVSANGVRLQGFVRDTWTNISLKLAPETKTRAEFLRYSRDITLDPNTADSGLKLSKGNRKVTVEDLPPLCRSSHPDSFIAFQQVLSGDPLTGRCYWEVVLKGRFTDVAASYKNISRAGYQSQFGNNEQSWSLRCHNAGASVLHNGVSMKVSSVGPSRVGVYLDHSAGLLSFYSVSETVTLLHRVQTTFTQPLYAGVSVEYWCEFVKLQ